MSKEKMRKRVDNFSCADCGMICQSKRRREDSRNDAFSENASPGWTRRAHSRPVELRKSPRRHHSGCLPALPIEISRGIGILETTITCETMKSPLPKEAYNKNALIYKILSNSKRLEVLNILKKKETSVEELLKITSLPKANLSQHLALMRHNGLIIPRRHGLNIFYRIVDPRIVEPCKILHDLRHRKLVV